MFCNGKCKKIENNEEIVCGLFYEVIMERIGPGGEKNVESIKKCAFHFMIDALHRLEQGHVRIQASVEESRNQKANDDHRSSTVIATGFMGLLHAFNKDQDKFMGALKLLNEAANRQPLTIEDKKNV